MAIETIPPINLPGSCGLPGGEQTAADAGEPDIGRFGNVALKKRGTCRDAREIRLGVDAGGGQRYWRIDRRGTGDGLHHDVLEAAGELLGGARVGSDERWRNGESAAVGGAQLPRFGTCQLGGTGMVHPARLGGIQHSVQGLSALGGQPLGGLGGVRRWLPRAAHPYGPQTVHADQAALGRQITGEVAAVEFGRDPCLAGKIGGVEADQRDMSLT